MSEWKKYRLSDIINLVGGGTPKTTVSEYWNGDIPWLSVVDFGKGIKKVHQTEKSITEKGLMESSTKILKEGQIIISARGTVGELAVLGRDMAFNQSCYGVYANEKTENNFLYYLLKYSIGKIKKNTHGAVFDTITKQTFDNIEVSIPEDKATQRQIAAILSSLDDKIELNLQMNQTLEAMAQAIFKEWFVDFNFPGFDGELVNGLPKGWRMGKLNEIAKIEIGRTPPRIEEEWFSTDPKDIKWISIKDLGLSGVYIFNTSEYLTQEAVEKFRIPIIPENTVVLSFKLTIGRLAITTETMLSNEAIAQIKSDSFSPEYIYTYLKTYNWGTLGSTSSIATAINSKIIKEMEVLIPDSKIEMQFQKVIKPIFEKLKTNSQEIESLIQLRDTLLPKLMSGSLNLDSFDLGDDFDEAEEKQ